MLGEAQVFDEAFDKAKIYGESVVGLGEARIFGEAWIGGNQRKSLVRLSSLILKSLKEK